MKSPQRDVVFCTTVALSLRFRSGFWYGDLLESPSFYGKCTRSEQRSYQIATEGHPHVIACRLYREEQNQQASSGVYQPTKKHQTSSIHSVLHTINIRVPDISVNMQSASVHIHKQKTAWANFPNPNTHSFPIPAVFYSSPQPTALEVDASITTNARYQSKDDDPTSIPLPPTPPPKDGLRCLPLIHSQHPALLA